VVAVVVALVVTVAGEEAIEIVFSDVGVEVVVGGAALSLLLPVVLLSSIGNDPEAIGITMLRPKNDNTTINNDDDIMPVTVTLRDLIKAEYARVSFKTLSLMLQYFVYTRVTIRLQPKAVPTRPGLCSL
jgi:hypothetical protein